MDEEEDGGGEARGWENRGVGDDRMEFQVENKVSKGLRGQSRSDHMSRGSIFAFWIQI